MNPSLKLQRPMDWSKKEKERQIRRQVFHALFLIGGVGLGTLLVWKLKALLLPIVVGALLAYLFRPLKDRFQTSWLPHELRVLILFACVGMGFGLGVNKLRKMIPDEKQKLELKVRLKYKLNEKYQQVVGKTEAEKRSNPISILISKEAGPAIDQVNHLLDLEPDEIELFEKYRKGFKGQEPIETRIYEYFRANQLNSVYTSVAPRDPAATAGSAEPADHAGEIKQSLSEELSIWILTPLIFIFLGFDNGQMRRYFVGLVPNRYFELSLTVMDELDDAIGKYLRGTLMECTLVGLSLSTGLFLLGLPMSVSLTIGLVSGLANAIPFLGPVIGLIIALGYSLIAESITPLIPWLNSQDLVFYVVFLILLVHILDNVVFQPIVLGGAVNLHPLVVTIAIISGSVMMGVWGMLLAIPTVVIVKTAVETLFKELKAYQII